MSTARIPDRAPTDAEINLALGRLIGLVVADVLTHPFGAIIWAARLEQAIEQISEPSPAAQETLL